MKKLLFSLGIIIAFTFYVVLNNQSLATRSAPAQATPSTSTLSDSQVPLTSSSTNDTASSSGSANPPVDVTPTPTPTSTGMYKDGTYDGTIANAFYGNIQVAAVIQGGKLTDVQFLSYPNDNGHSMEVSSFALPALKQEAIQSQSANVNIVSGATQDSGAFQQSLASALAEAAN